MFCTDIERQTMLCTGKGGVVCRQKVLCTDRETDNVVYIQSYTQCYVQLGRQTMLCVDRRTDNVVHSWTCRRTALYIDGVTDGWMLYMCTDY